MEQYEIENRIRIINTIDKIPYGIPKGWKRNELGIGGLTYVGFSNIFTSKLICISEQGQSIIDCETGEIVFCAESYDELNLTAMAAELNNELIHIAGIGGGGLRHFSKDGNTLLSVAPYYPKEKIVFMPNYQSCFLKPEECIVIFEDYEIRTFGFSKCGNYMVACCSSDLYVFKKET